MDDLAASGAQRWYEATELFKRPSAAYRPLRIHLRGLISEDADVGIAFQEGDPVVVVLHGDRFTIARPVDPDSEHSPIIFESIPLASPMRVDLMVGEAQLSEGVFRARTWTIGEPRQAALVIATRARTSRLAPEEYQGEALVARAATRLGWPGKEA